MPYSHFHDWSFHTHRRRPKGGNHWRAVRHRQRPWRIVSVVALAGVIIVAAVVLSARNEVFTKIMMAVQQERITPAPSPVQVDEQAERRILMLPSATPFVTATRTREPVVASDVPLIPTASDAEGPIDTVMAQSTASVTTDIPTLTATPVMTSTPTSTLTPTPTLTAVAPTFTLAPAVTVTPTSTPTTPEPTATAIAILTATATPTAEERELTMLETPPEHMVYAWWDWDYQNPLRNQQSALNEITVEIEIHNDIELGGAGNGIYLMVCSGDVDGIGYYFGLQTDVHNNNANVSLRNTGKGLIFSRWKERNLANARIPDDGFTESSGHEGNFIGVRRNYDWGVGKYLLRMGQDGPDDPVGRWYGLWVTDLAVNQETWIGSMRFPYIGGRALLGPRCYNTVEIYGPPIASRDIPYWKVTLNPPKGDGKVATVTDDGFSPFTGSYRNTRFSYDENGAVIYEIGLDHIPASR